jgi:uncharacterized protein YbjT (DUF2867 family)
MSRVLVTAALGTTGSFVAELLRARGHEVTAASRRVTGFDWYQPGTYAEALVGARAVYLVPPSGEPAPADVMTPFLAAARDAGVRRAVLLSASPAAPGAPGVGRVHSLIPDFFAEWAVLRPTWFMQNVLAPQHPHAISIREDGVLVTSTDGARVALIDANDIADVAAHLLTADVTPNTDLILTGPESLTYDEVAATIADVIEQPLRHRDVPEPELRAYLGRFLPPAAAERMAALDRIIATGSQAGVTDTVRKVTGRAPRPFAAWAVSRRGKFVVPA